jgi:hypothetical protein
MEALIRRERYALASQVDYDGISIRDRGRLFNSGKYLVIFGPSSLSEVQFQIASSGAHRDCRQEAA